MKLVGYCDEDDVLLLVLQYMHNGTLYDHLHDDKHSNSGAISSWHLRVKIALEAARGIEYLHTYAVPAVIHRDIKSSNILLDASWTACVSDFGLSLLGPEEEVSHISMAAAGTMGCIDLEYYRLQHLTTKSNVYSFGVVLLELRTVGRKAISKCSNKNKGIPANQLINVVDFSTPRVQAHELVSILDFRLPIPQGLELQAVSILASVAEHCVRQEGKGRPSTTHIVTRLEQAFSFSCKNRRKLQPAPQESSDQYNNNNNAAANSSIANWIHQEIEELGLKHDDDDDDDGHNDDDQLSLCGDVELHHRR
jgi:serine/threonine protein kinase